LPSGTAISGEYLAKLLRQCEAYDGKIFIAEEAKEVIGYVCVLSRVPTEEAADGVAEEARLVDLVVTERARGKGVGSRLLEVAEAFAASTGAEWLRVQVFSWNQAARNLYEGNGFSEFEITMEKSLRVDRT
jgi:GNAT superfamily N-acetyltransferase